MLRDANLRVRRLAIGGGENIALEGCLSTYGPAAQGVRYLLRMADGSERVLAIGSQAAGLAVCISQRGETTTRSFNVDLDLELDPNFGRGRLSAPAIAARVPTEGAFQKDVEHFLRRLVQSAIRGATSSR